MLNTARQQTAMQTVSLDACGGGAVMLSLDDGGGHVFRQALDAHDAGKLLRLIDIRRPVNECVLCQGDLQANYIKEYEELHFTWPDERGGNGLVQIDLPGVLVFEEALRSYCRMFMRSQEVLP